MDKAPKGQALMQIVQPTHLSLWIWSDMMNVPTFS